MESNLSNSCKFPLIQECWHYIVSCKWYHDASSCEMYNMTRTMHGAHNIVPQAGFCVKEAVACNKDSSIWMSHQVHLKKSKLQWHTFYCTTEKQVYCWVQWGPRYSCCCMMLFSPGILGIPTDDVLQANESSVDIGLSKGVSKEIIYMQLRKLQAIIIKQQVTNYIHLSVKLYTAKNFYKKWWTYSYEF